MIDILIEASILNSSVYRITIYIFFHLNLF